MRQRVKLLVTDEKGEKELIDYKVDDLVFRPRKRREKVKMDDCLLYTSCHGGGRGFESHPGRLSIKI